MVATTTTPFDRFATNMMMTITFIISFSNLRIIGWLLQVAVLAAVISYIDGLPVTSDVFSEGWQVSFPHVLAKISNDSTYRPESLQIIIVSALKT